MALIFEQHYCGFGAFAPEAGSSFHGLARWGLFSVISWSLIAFNGFLRAANCFCSCFAVPVFHDFQSLLDTCFFPKKIDMFHFF